MGVSKTPAVTGGVAPLPALASPAKVAEAGPEPAAARRRRAFSGRPIGAGSGRPVTPRRPCLSEVGLTALWLTGVPRLDRASAFSGGLA